MSVSHNNQTNDQIVCQAVVYGGTLTVTTNAGDAPLVAGNAFRLFNRLYGLLCFGLFWGKKAA
jgi:hypothetical protein